MRSRIKLAANSRALLVALASMTLLIALACGSDDSPAESPDSTLTPTSIPPTAEPPTPEPTPTSVPPSPTPTSAPTSTPASQPTATPATGGLPVTVTDASGEEVTVTDISRIVSLNGDFTEIIYALGLEENLIAVDTSATYPPEALELPKVGYQRSLSSEGILAMEPTLVIGGTAAGPPETLDQIREAGVTVAILETEPTIAGSAKKIRDIATALGVPEKGEELATQLEADVEEAKALAAQAEGDAPTAIFVYIRGLDTLLIAGNGDLSADLFEAAGAISGGVEAGFNGFVPMTAEALVTTAPDFIVAFESGLESVGGIDGLLEVPGVAQTPAGENRAIITFDGLFFAGGGPRTGEALMQLVLALHPELSN